MDHTKNRIILLFMLLLYAQVYAQTPTSSNRVEFMSPQVADFVKYGNLQPSLYTGQLGLNIPLFNAKDGDFNVPVAIGNNSEGFKPTQAVGPVGMNWYLSVGGAITRKVNGYADDNEASPSFNINSASYSGKGFYLVAKNILPNVNKDDVFHFNIGAAEPTQVWNVGYYLEPTTEVIYDYEPDEFSFNFMGHSGKFFISNDGTPRVISDERIKVTLTGMATQSIGSLGAPVDSYIILTTADGYKYYFGGDTRYLEYSFPINSNFNVAAAPIINTWNLAKVVSPSGKELTLSYRSFNPYLSYDADPNFDPNHYIMNHSAFQLSGFTETINYFWGQPLKNYGGYNEVGDSYSVTKTSYLERVESENFSLVFQYSEKANKTQPWLWLDYTFFNDKTLQLNNIAYNSKSDGSETLLSSVTFSYSYLGGANPRHFLTSVQESGKNPYTFTYYNLDGQNPVALPITITHQLDHWGYWNGYSSSYPSLDLIPDVSVDPSQNGDVVMSGPKRAPNAAYSVVGMLKTVTYPTGGYSTFEYQANDYSNRLERRAVSAFLPALFSVDGVAGGVRISKISDHNGTAIENVREYKYKKDYLSGGTLNESAPSSGLLMDYPRYLHFWTIDQYYMNLRMSSSSYGTNYNVSEPFINYSEVTEVTNGNGYKVYKFSNYATNPDIKDDDEKELTSSSFLQPKNLYKNYVGFRLNNRARDRGKLRFLNTFDVNKNPVSSVENIYTPASTVNYTVGILACSGNFAQAYKIYEDNPHLEQTINKVWNSGQQIATTENFIYDVYGQLTEKSTTTSKGETILVDYRYPYDLTASPNDPTGVHQAMLNNHVINSVITEQTKINGTQTGYKMTNYYSPVAGVFRPQSVQQQGLTSDPYEYREFYTHSAASGWNLESVTQPGSPLTYYIWGYNKQYPVAEVKNTKVNEVYHNNFEEETDFVAPYVVKDATRAHTGKYSGLIANTNPGAFVINANTWLQVNLGGQTKKFKYSGWIYSTGPSATLFLFMKRPGETGGWSYVDWIPTTETNEWVYLEKEFTVPADVSQLNLRIDNNSTGNVWYDDLRIMPSEGQMTTYTYYPQVGIRSSIDNNGITTYYEYDSYQRLTDVKDKDGKIVKHMDYHYKQ